MRAAAVAVAALGMLVASGLAAGAASAPPTADATTADSPRPATTTYCVRGRGVSADEVAAFALVAQQILAEVDGWSLGGTLRFAQRDDCETSFTLWLAAAEQLPSFGYPCHPNWSCRQGRNVIVNRDRWHGATTAWNAAGASLGDYRRMVVNHEVGHWLGFGHVGCPAPGAPAPVMQQQSKSLQGCAANPLPTGSERAQAARARSLEILGPIDEGDAVRVVGAPTVFVVDEGRLRAVPDAATLAQRAPGGWVRVVAARDLAGWPRGRPVPTSTRTLTATGTLLRADGAPTVWVVLDGRRHAVPDRCTFEQRDYYRSDVRVVDPAEVAAVDAGVPLLSVCAEPPPAPRTVERVCPPGEVAADGLADPARSAHEPAIDCAVWRGLARGPAPGQFEPGGQGTRGQAASLLDRALTATGGALATTRDY